MEKLKLSTNEPFIMTIPDECAPFLILDKGTAYFDKFVLENYINFYSFDYKNHISDGFCLRFENYINWESIDGFSSLFIPLDIQKHTKDLLSLLIDMLKQGYLLLCDYNTNYIPTTKREHPAPHRIIIEGFDNNEEKFFCRDFVKKDLVSFEVQFQNMENALKQYPWPGEKNAGIRGIKQDRDHPNCEISICKLFLSLNSLCSDSLIQKNDGIEAFGKRALTVFREGILHYNSDEEQIGRCFYYLNYIRESCKLMKYRLDYFERANKNIISHETLTCFLEFKKLIDINYFKLLKLDLLHRIQTDDIKKCVEMGERIEDVLTNFIKLFRDDIYLLIDKGIKEIDFSTLYTSAECYNA